MKSHERKEVNSYSASWWLLEYPQITDRSQKSLAIEQTLIYGIISTIIFHVSKYRPIFFSVNAPESVSHVNTLQHWAGRWGTRRGWWFVFVFLLSSKSEKKRGGKRGLVDTATHSACSLPEMISPHACMPLNCIHIWPIWCECHLWDPAQWFPRTHVHENELLHWYFWFSMYICVQPSEK